jgi:cytochrome c biogenesis protein CcmG, thiol:disulfide interchange protein DsbE
MKRLLAAGAAVALVAIAAGCSGGGSGADVGLDAHNPTHAQLVSKADLAPCPSSTAAAVSGGLPNVTLPCLGQGPQVRLSGLAGKPTVVNLWGSWCEPCQAEMQYLSSAYNADRSVVRFLGVDTVDDADSALDFDAHVTPPVHFPSVFDENRQVALGLHTEATPDTVFVASDGRIVHTHPGAYHSTAELQADISRYLHVRT